MTVHSHHRAPMCQEWNSHRRDIPSTSMSLWQDQKDSAVKTPGIVEAVALWCAVCYVCVNNNQNKTTPKRQHSSLEVYETTFSLDSSCGPGGTCAKPAQEYSQIHEPPCSSSATWPTPFSNCPLRFLLPTSSFPEQSKQQLLFIENILPSSH